MVAAHIKVGGSHYTKEEALGFVMGCNTMIQVFAEAFQKVVPFHDAVQRVSKWHDTALAQ